MDLEQLRALDETDPLAGFRERFALPPGVVYLAGNSLGPPPRAALARVAAVAEQDWGGEVVKAWTSRDWVGAPARTGGKIARVVGAKPSEVAVADSTSVDLFKLIVAALQAAPDRPTLLAVKDDFPTDLYVAEGAAALLGRRMRLVERAEVQGALREDVALVLLTHTHFRSAEVYDMAEVNRAAQAAGVRVLWDLSHSAGVVPVDLNGSGAELAVGCGYKYLNGGPGAPAWLYVAEALQDRLASPLAGWMGHAAPFDFAGEYRPAPGVLRFQCGTPPILSLAALEAAVEVLLEADMAAVAAKARRLGDLMLELAARHCPWLERACPGPGERRGGHVAFRHPRGAEISRALTERGVVGDFRPPDLLRFGLSPLFVRYQDVGLAIEALAHDSRS